MQTLDQTPFYIKTKDGKRYFVETAEEAIEEFIGENGFSLTITIDKKILVVQRNFDWKNVAGGKECFADVTYKEF